jgi:hypothetical protein
MRIKEAGGCVVTPLWANPHVQPGVGLKPNNKTIPLQGRGPKWHQSDASEGARMEQVAAWEQAVMAGRGVTPAVVHPTVMTTTGAPL